MLCDNEALDAIDRSIDACPWLPSSLPLPTTYLWVAAKLTKHDSLHVHDSIDCVFASSSSTYSRYVMLQQPAEEINRQTIIIIIDHRFQHRPRSLSVVDVAIIYQINRSYNDHSSCGSVMCG